MVRNSVVFSCLRTGSFLFVLLITIIDRKYTVAGGLIDEYCIDRTVPWQRQDIRVRTGACPWPVSEDGADMPELGAFDALAWHSWRPFCAPFSTSSSDFGTRS